MTDTRLRNLERRFHETGSVEDEAAWITERLRVGELARDRVELAAYCGHEAAVVALEGDAPEIPVGATDWETLVEWFTGLDSLTEERAGVLARGAAARVGLSTFEAEFPEDRRPRAALDAVRDWAYEPANGKDDAEALLREISGLWDGIGDHLPAGSSARAVAWTWSWDHAEPGLRPPPFRLLRDCLRRTAATPAEVHAAVVAELIPWALGERDPMRERVEARQGSGP